MDVELSADRSRPRELRHAPGSDVGAYRTLCRVPRRSRVARLIGQRKLTRLPDLP